MAGANTAGIRRQPFVAELNRSMISTIKDYGVSDLEVLMPLEKVHRHLFIPKRSGFGLEDMYSDNALPIGSGQTISQPFTVAFMLSLLELKQGQHVLEIGSGSGWNAAVIKEIVGSKGRVTTIESVPEIARTARHNLKRLGYNISVVEGDGSVGYTKNAPYDRIIVTCASPDILSEWKEQLKPGGIIVAPVGRYVQEMVKFRKNIKSYYTRAGEKRQDGMYSAHGSFSFVPLLGRKGFEE